MFSYKIMGKKAFIMHVTMQHDQVGGKGDELFFLRTKTVHEWIDIDLQKLNHLCQRHICCNLKNNKGHDTFHKEYWDTLLKINL